MFQLSLNRLKSWIEAGMVEKNIYSFTRRLPLPSTKASTSPRYQGLCYLIGQFKWRNVLIGLWLADFSRGSGNDVWPQSKGISITLHSISLRSGL